MMDLKTTPYVSILAQHPCFDTGPSPGENLPLWSYMPPEAPPLVELRTRYGLSELVSGRSELDAILKLLEWVYLILEHDGSAANPEPRDALTILHAGLKEQRAVNCRMKAIVLNEVYLSLGFSSRYLTCLPADFDSDCHVIVLVYSVSLGKWISVDPTHNTFFVDRDGTILNALEARRIYQTGKTPVLHPIQRQVTAPLFCGGIRCSSYDEFYQVYMCKNCFRFACPISSEFGYESKPEARFVFLNPLGYDSSRGRQYEPDHNGSIIYYTHNDTYFLAEPASL